jgi:Arc/MetJ-type ribon-helix-helix transcriptional regulator
MEIRPTPDQEAFIRDAIEAGRIDSAEDAAKEALALWEESERRRSEILAAVDIAQPSTVGGEGIEITRESMRVLAEDVKRRGRARLAVEQHEMPR